MAKDLNLSPLPFTPVIKMTVNPEERKSTGRRMLAGVMGWPIEHSLSPRLHQFWLKQYGIDGDYVKLAVKPENLAAELRALRQNGFRGVNLTLPHKEAALALLDVVDPTARRVGAVNTVIVRDDSKLEGRNGDVSGFAENLCSAGFKAAGPAVILGAGGAGRAAIAALVEMGVKDIRLLNRTREHAEKLASDFGLSITLYPWNDMNALEGAQLLVNATSLGLKDQPPLDIPLERLPSSAWVADVVYTPLETDLLKRAKARGNRCIDGLGMLLHQARPAFAAFYGWEPAVTDELRHFVAEGAA